MREKGGGKKEREGGLPEVVHGHPGANYNDVLVA